MKRLFILILIATNYHAYSQNYMEEAYKISRMQMANTRATDVDVIYKKAYQYLRQNNNNAADAFNTSSKHTLTPGAINTNEQPAESNAAATVTDTALLRYEIKKIIELNTDPCSVTDFPEHIEYLDAITQSASSGFGNSGTAAAHFAFSEANIIYGITDFVIKRAKEELMETYLTQWYQKLNGDIIIKPLIPQTLSVYEAFLNDNSINISKYGDKWKSAFQEDLRNLPVQLQDEDYVNMLFTKINMTNDLKNELLPVVCGGNELLYNLYLKKHLVNTLSDMAVKYRDNTDAKSAAVFKRVIVMANLISRLCGSIDHSNNFIPVAVEDLQKIDTKAWQVLLKLLYARNKKDILLITAGNINKFCAMMNDSIEIQKFANAVHQSISLLTSYQLLLSGINTNAATLTQLTFDDCRKVFDLSYQLLDKMSAFTSLINTEEKVRTIYTNNVKPYFTYFSEIGEGVSTQQYGKVLDGSIAVIRKTAALCNDATLDSTTIKNLQRYGSFMLNVLTAKDADAVETALDELVPKGQYKIKNSKTFTASLSAYPGIFGGVETIRKYHTDDAGNIDYKGGKINSSASSFSVYLPIGIDVSFGDKVRVKNKTDKRSSTNLFLQFIDLGSVLNYRINSDSTESTNPDISFKQLLSPGISLMRHLSNSPVTLGVGVNYTPDLRTIKQEGITYQQNALRYGLFIGVDVTGLILHSSKSNTKDK